VKRDVAVLIRFRADGQARAFPILDVPADALHLADRLQQLALDLLEIPDALSCVLGWHEHSAGTCLPR